MNVCIISFSSRKDGNCAEIKQFICSLYPDARCFDFSDFTIASCGNCKYECFASGDQCPFIKDKEYQILDAITNSDLTYFVVPNYCDFPCSNFFVFNERSLCYFHNSESLLNAYLNVHKKFVVVSNTNTENFKTLFAYQTNDEPQILFLSSNKYAKRSIDGNLLTSEQAIEDLKKFVLQ